MVDQRADAVVFNADISCFARRRFALPNASFRMRKSSLEYGIRGQAIDIKVEALQMMKTNKKVVEEFARLTGQPAKKLENDLRRDFFLTPEEAKEYGLIDKVLEPQGVGWEGDGEGPVGFGDMGSGSKKW